MILATGQGAARGLARPTFHHMVVLKQTLLTGKPKITRKEACDKMRSSRENGRKSLPKDKWTDVMAAAALQHPEFLWFQGETLCLKVVLDTSDGKVKYHSELMKDKAAEIAAASAPAQMDRKP